MGHKGGIRFYGGQQIGTARRDWRENCWIDTRHNQRMTGSGFRFFSLASCRNLYCMAWTSCAKLACMGGIWPLATHIVDELMSNDIFTYSPLRTFESRATPLKPWLRFSFLYVEHV